MSLIQKLFGRNDATDKLLDVIDLNKADDAWVESFRRRTADAGEALAGLYAEFATDPSDKLAEKILAAASAIEGKRAALDKLTALAHAPIKKRIAERTIPVLRHALESIKAKLESELAASRERDTTYGADSLRMVGGAVDGGWKSAEDLAAVVKSPATAALERELQQCNGYLERIETATEGAIKFVLG